MTVDPRGWFADVLLTRPPREARAEALALVNDGMPVAEVYLDVLAPALHEVGERWQAGGITVAQEHLATALVSSVIATLAPGLGGRPLNGHEVVLACTDGEQHAVGLRMVGDFLEADGFSVMYLGALTPGADLEHFAWTRHPSAVCLSTTITTHLEMARTVIGSLRRLPRAPFILVGGGAYLGDPEVARSMGADAFAPDAGAAAMVLRAALGLDP